MSTTMYNVVQMQPYYVHPRANLPTVRRDTDLYASRTRSELGRIPPYLAPVGLGGGDG